MASNAAKRTRGPCTSCKHHRDAASTLPVLRREVGGKFGPAVRGALQELRRFERDVVQEERAELVYKMTPGQTEEEWDARPIRYPYCGVEEGDNRYFLPDVKNEKLKCVQFDEGPSSGRTCSSCRHNRRSAAEQVLERLREVISAFTVGGADLWPGVEEEYAQVVVEEIETAHRHDGVLPNAPSSLPLCKSLSGGGRFVVSVLHNPADGCEEWAPGSPGFDPKLRDLSAKYAQVKSAYVAGTGPLSSDPRVIASKDFITAAMDYLGIGSAASRVIASLHARESSARTDWANQNAPYATPHVPGPQM